MNTLNHLVNTVASTVPPDYPTQRFSKLREFCKKQTQGQLSVFELDLLTKQVQKRLATIERPSPLALENVRPVTNYVQ